MNTLTTRTYAHARMHVHMAGRRHGEDLPLEPCNWGCDYTFTYTYNIYVCIYMYAIMMLIWGMEKPRLFGACPSTMENDDFGYAPGMRQTKKSASQVT